MPRNCLPESLEAKIRQCAENKTLIGKDISSLEDCVSERMVLVLEQTKAIWIGSANNN